MVRCDTDITCDPPAVGSIVTVKHSGYYSTGKLKQPVFWRERKDVTWEDILATPQFKVDQCDANKIICLRNSHLRGLTMKTTKDFLIGLESSLVSKSCLIGTMSPKRTSTRMVGLHS